MSFSFVFHFINQNTPQEFFVLRFFCVFFLDFDYEMIRRKKKKRRFMSLLHRIVFFFWRLPEWYRLALGSSLFAVFLVRGTRIFSRGAILGLGGSSAVSPQLLLVVVLVVLVRLLVCVVVALAGILLDFFGWDAWDLLPLLLLVLWVVLLFLLLLLLALMMMAESLFWAFFFLLNRKINKLNNFSLPKSLYLKNIYCFCFRKLSSAFFFLLCFVLFKKYFVWLSCIGKKINAQEFLLLLFFFCWLWHRV